MAARAQVSPARRAAFEVLRRVFEDDAYADRAFRSAAAGLDERDRALAQRLAFGAVQRVRTLDHAIETLGRRPVRKLDPPVRAALRLGAYQLGFVDGVPRYAAVNESVELVRAARGSSARSRSRTRCCAASRTGSGRCSPRSPRRPRTRPRSRTRTRTGSPRPGGATSAPTSARALMRAQNEPAELVVRLVRGEIDGEPTDVPGAWRVERIDEAALAEGRIWPQSRASQLVGLAVGARDGRAHARPLRGARRQGDDARGRGRRGRGERGAGAGARGDRRGGSAPRTSASSSPTAASSRPSSRASTARSWTRPAPASASSNSRPDLRWRAEPLPELQLELLRAAAERVRPGGTIVYSVCTINADEAEAVVDASGLEVDATLGDEWPQFRHPQPARVPADAAARARHGRLLRRPAHAR